MTSISSNGSGVIVSGLVGLIAGVFGGKVPAPKPHVVIPVPAPAVPTKAPASVDPCDDEWVGPAFIF